MPPLVSQGRIAAELKAESKREVLAELAELAARDLGRPPQEVATALLRREEMGSTGIGEGIAIPHAQLDGLAAIETFFGRSLRGVSFNAADSRPVHFFLLVLAPPDPGTDYLTILARASRLLRDGDRRAALLQAADAAALHRLLVD